MALIIREDKYTVGERIKRLRKAKNMTMDELASKIGVQKSAINKYEKGVIDSIPERRLESIAYALGTTYEYLTTGYDSLGDEVVVYDDFGNAYQSDVTPIQELIALLQTISPARYDLIKKVLTLPPERLDALATLLNIEN